MTFEQIIEELEYTIYSKEDLKIVKNKLEKLWTILYKKQRNKTIENIELKWKIDTLSDSHFYTIDQEPRVESLFLDKDLFEKYSNKVLVKKEIELILRTIVSETRAFLESKKHSSITDLPLTGYCIEASDFIQYRFARYFDCYTLQTQNIFSPNMCHFFTILHLSTREGVKSYLIDTTYRQFCLLSMCNKNRIYHYESVVLPGAFVNDIQVIKELLYKGYIEINEHTSKIYGDSFVLSNQSSNGIINKTTNIMGKQYMHTLYTGKCI